MLDFGLAKALDPNPEGDPSQSPTLTAAATQIGVIMGTAAYMSPEQARGKTVDKRADIWGFGVVLYELLTGRRAFEGEDVSLTLSAVLQQEPEWERLPDGLSPALDTYLNAYRLYSSVASVSHGSPSHEITRAIDVPGAVSRRNPGIKY